jgi:hypothetical protein
LHLLAGLSVADGLVYGQCSLHKRFLDFRTFVQSVFIAETLRRDVRALALVLDNGSTHAPKQLARWLHELNTEPDGKVALQLYWLPKNASWLDQIEIWFSLLQRKLLQPKLLPVPTSCSKRSSTSSLAIIRWSNPSPWSYTFEKLEHKLSTHL